MKPAGDAYTWIERLVAVGEELSATLAEWDRVGDELEGLMLMSDALGRDEGEGRLSRDRAQELRAVLSRALANVAGEIRAYAERAHELKTERVALTAALADR